MDPDILVFEGNHYANTVLDYLFARIEKLGFSLLLGREKTTAALSANLKRLEQNGILSIT